VGGVSSSGTAGLRVDTGIYKVVYFAFGFEGINAAADRATVMGRVLGWLLSTPPSQVTITGPTSGSTNSAYSFRASVAPISATMPLSYVWQATGIAPITHTAGLSDTVSFTWPTAGTKVITVRASNGAGMVTDTHTVTILAPGMNYPTMWSTAFGRLSGWTTQNLYPRFVADVNKDGRADAVGFGANGVYVARSTGSSFAPAARWIANFGAGQGWTSQDRYPRMLADVNKDGRADIVGFGQYGVMVSLATAANTFAPPTRWLANFGYSQGWTSQNLYPRAVADVNGDGRADVVGFGNYGVMVSLATAANTFAPPTRWIAAFGRGAGGWTSQDTFPRLVADVNGDGRADVVGFSMYGTYVSLCHNGTHFDPATRWIANYGTVIGGWTSQNLYPRALGDVNGDGKADIVGFGNAGAFVSISTGTAFGAPFLGVPAFGRGAAAGGWASQDLYPRTVADATGGGKADLVGFGNYGALVAVSR
jgi:hypothetical protein